jgi:hypothetical protein
MTTSTQTALPLSCNRTRRGHKFCITPVHDRWEQYGIMARWLFLMSALAMIPWPVGAQGSGRQYCAEFYDGSPSSCGFSSLQMCEQSVTGVGGVCSPSSTPSSMPSSMLGAAPAALPQTSYNPPMPPPPIDPSPSGPLTLPDAVRPQPQPQPCNPAIDGTYCASADNGAAPAMQSLSSDLAIRGDDAATFGGITFSGSGSACIGLLRQMTCGG